MEHTEIGEEAWVWAVEGECMAEKVWVVEVVICKDEGDIISVEHMEDMVALWVKDTNLEEEEDLMARLVCNEVVMLVVREVLAYDPPVLAPPVQGAAEHLT